MKKLLIILYLFCSIAMQAKEINENKTYKKGAKTEGNRKEKHLNKRQHQWGVWDAIVDFADWLTSPFRPVWGDYVEDGMRAGNPWPKTMFPRSVNDDVPAMVNTIREKVIIDRSFENNMYNKIYTNAQEQLPSLFGYGYIANETGVSSNFSIGKNAAFVYMIGKRPIKVNGTYDLTPSEREEFLNKAIISLTRQNAFSSFVDGVGLNQITDQISVPLNGNWNKIQYRSKELIMMCQAYDILETCKNRLGLIPNQNFDNVRSNIKGFAVSMYRDLNAWFGMRIAKNNYTLMPCGALGLAAIMLNTERTFLWATYNKPKNWINSAMYNMHETMWSCDDPMSKAGDIYGFAEGPGYFKYSFENLLPFFKAFDNFVSYKSLTQTYRLPVGGALPTELSPFSHRVKHPYYDEDYKNLYRWCKNIQQPDGTMPSYDDTYAGWYFGALAISGSNEFSLFGSSIDISKNISPFVGSSGLDLTADYLTSMNFYKENANLETEEVKLINMPNSGNFLIKSNVLDNDGKIDRHYLHLLSEKNVPNYPLFSDLIVQDYHTHEHPDAGSFTIMADDDQLLIDPAYNYDNEGVVNQINTYMAHNGLPFSPTNYDFYTESNNQLNSMAFICKSGSDLVSKRNITPFLTPDQKQKIYYELTDDFLNPDAESSTFAIRFNGNGNSGEGTFSVTNIDNVIRAKWDHPCSGRKPSGEWGLLLESTNITNGNNTILNYLTEGQVHGNISGVSAITNLVSTIGYGGGYHTRLNIHVPLTTGKTNYMTIMTPYKCTDPPQFSESVSGDRLRGLLKKVISNNNDTTFNLHVVHDRSQKDSIINPFTFDSLAVLKTDAQKVFFSYSKNNMFKTGNCIAFTNFRKVRVENCTELIYNSKSYIKSNAISSVSYSLIGKYKYSGYIENATDSIDFYLPDMDTNYAMAASGDGITYSYNDSLHVITIFATKNNVEFIIHLLDPCLVSCYFPSTYKKITNTFNFNSGNTEVLGHKLEIKQPTGNLQITNSSKMIISCDKYLYNKDSLILEGPCQSKAFEHKICNGIDGLVAAYSDNSSITINTNCALVLELGSYTYVKNGGAIYVKQGGSLIVKAGAYLEIGDSGTCNQGWGEIIAEPGAYIHIEPGAQIIYRSTIGDTSDRNMFIIPTASGMPQAYHGVGYFIKTILNQDTILPLTFPTYPICGLDTTNPIINKPWGYTNFAKPLATFQVKNDTICPNEPLYIKLNRILNDAKTAIEVCRIDSFKVYYRDLDSSLFRWQDTCIIDTLIKDSILPDPVCKEPRTAPDDLTFWFKAGTTHRVTIKVWNDCGMMDDTLSYIHVLDSPKAIISVPDFACEGRGTVTANLSKRSDLPITYKIEIIEKQDTIIDFYKPLNAYNKTYYGVLPSSINFNDFYFKGGKTYFVLLTLINECGSYTNYDSVKIPLSAKIILERPTVYSQQLDAATSVKLHGYTSSIDSFKWEPTTWLDSANSLTPISTPFENINYVLLAYKNGCIATDTAYIKYNKYANAGHNDTLCYTNGQAVVLGNTFDYSMFLGWMCYYDTAAFNKRFNDKIIRNNLNIHYFTAFMHHDLFKKFMDNNSSFKAHYENFVTKHLILNQNWYPEYLNMLYDNSISKTAAFNYFVDRINEGESTVIRDNLDSIADASIIESNLKALFDKFKTFNDEYLADIKIYWNGITDYEGKFELSYIGHNQLIYQLPTQTQKYTYTVIAYSTTEIDEITVMVDTVLTPLFYPALQFDSTVFFINNTQPISSATNYEWNFGDGSAISNELNPIHTFPAFDSNYVVCLTASNKCNSWQYCDTVWVDSLHLGGALKTANKPAFFETNNQQAPEKINVRSALGIKPEARIQQFVALQNYPNPFNQSTIIDYQIWQNFNQAELRITNLLGQVLYTQKLQKPIDKVEIDGSNLANGLYYYSIVVDNSVKLTKTMSVIH